jgi:flagellar biosynthesis/type III secretory pathway protein FliH
MRDYNAILELAKEKAQSEVQEKGLTHNYAEWYIQGYIEGFMLGYVEGWVCAQREIAGKLIAASMAVDMIAKYTDLSIEEIEALKS